ncbi:universal stress protein [Methylobacterium komagatae]|uniref:Universal stress protein n=1 Tax=Methylobacterium komagatae TaxID=374425 RepID=A0ABW2BEQ3_9HYPH
MDFANILVSTDLGEAAPDRIRLAADLARRFGSHLTGAAARAVPVPLLVRDVYDAVAQEDRNITLIHQLLDRAHALFERSAGKEIATDWKEALTDPTTHLVGQARAADLVVIGQRKPGNEDPGALGVAPGPLLMQVGRPVLMAPSRLDQLKGNCILVAWKDGVEARRAVLAALPFLRSAEQVLVASIGAETAGDADVVAGHLARHGAQVASRTVDPVDSEGGAIIDLAAREGADLIVMGAYGRSRLKEWLFGGVTRELLDRAPVCCLMSH